MNNLAKRTLTSVVFVLVMAAGILLPYTFALFALFMIIIYQAMCEFYSITLGGRRRKEQKLAIFCGIVVLMVWITHLQGGLSLKWLAVAGVLLLAIPLYEVLKPQIDSVGELAYIYAGILYIALPLTIAVTPAFTPMGYNGFILLSLFIVIWICDVGAYCVGSTIGQKPGMHKMAPLISPKKSWWGFGGGVAFGIAAAVGLHFLGWLPYGIWQCVAIGAILSVGGIYGDLVESLWKRWAGVKDSGNCIPGHGGMLDRFDSSMVALPLSVLYMALAGLI